MTVASTNSNIGVTRTSSNSSSQLGMVRSSYNSNEIGAMRSPRSTSSGLGVTHVPNTMSNSFKSYGCAPGQSQPARSKVMIGPSNHGVQLQSLSEVEEMDVRPEASEGPPKYSQLFLEIEVYTKLNVHFKVSMPLLYSKTLCHSTLCMYTGATRGSKSKATQDH